MIGFLYAGEYVTGLLAGVCLFVPWYERRNCFILRVVLSVATLFGAAAPSFVAGTLPLEVRATFVVLALLVVVPFCFRCGFTHAVFSVTCAYAVQHMTSKFTFMVVALLDVPQDLFGHLEAFSLLALSNVVVCALVYYLFTRRYLRDKVLVFSSMRTGAFAALFLAAAIYLSSVVERSLEQGTPAFTEGYISLNLFCIIFAITILSLEITNCGVKRLENENYILESLLEKDKKQYERAREDMEKINIRYHDLKQRYVHVSSEERAGLEDEMRALSLRYLTGNKALDIVVTQKAAVCAKKGIQLICSADGEVLDGMRSYHIYSLFGNALDNAIECLDKVEDRSRRIIRVNVAPVGEMAVIRIENYTPSEPVLENGEPVTTKGDSEGHGYGMKSIRQVAESYEGSSDFFVRDHVFYLVVTLPLAEMRRHEE